jgi:hypothetical protein
LEHLISIGNLSSGLPEAVSLVEAISGAQLRAADRQTTAGPVSGRIRQR